MRAATCLVPSAKEEVRERRVFVCFVLFRRTNGTGRCECGCECECEIFKRFFKLIASHLALNPSNRDDDAGTTTMDDVRLSDGFDDCERRRRGIVGDAGGPGKVCEEMDG